MKSPSKCPICGVIDGEEHIHESHRVLMAGMPEIEGKILDAIADRALAHKPKPKSKPARKRARRAKKLQAADV